MHLQELTIHRSLQITSGQEGRKWQGFWLQASGGEKTLCIGWRPPEDCAEAKVELSQIETVKDRQGEGECHENQTIWGARREQEPCKRQLGVGSELAASATRRLDSLLGHYSCQPVMEQLLEAHLHPKVLSLQRQPCPCREPRSGWEREETQPLSSRSPQGPATQRSQLSNSSDLDKKAQEGTRWVGLLTPLKIEHGFRGTVSQRNGLAQHSVSCQLNTNTDSLQEKNSHSQGQGSHP